MLTPDQERALSQMSLVDVINYFTVPRVLSCIDPLHAVVVYGFDEVLKALEQYENHSPD